jgi:hypothetical protein
VVVCRQSTPRGSEADTASYSQLRTAARMACARTCNSAAVSASSMPHARAQVAQHPGDMLVRLLPVVSLHDAQRSLQPFLGLCVIVQKSPYVRPRSLSVMPLPHARCRSVPHRWPTFALAAPSPSPDCLWLGTACPGYSASAPPARARCRSAAPGWPARSSSSLCLWCSPSSPYTMPRLASAAASWM